MGLSTSPSLRPGKGSIRQQFIKSSLFKLKKTYQSITLHKKPTVRQIKQKTFDEEADVNPPPFQERLFRWGKMVGHRSFPLISFAQNNLQIMRVIHGFLIYYRKIMSIVSNRN